MRIPELIAADAAYADAHEKHKHVAVNIDETHRRVRKQVEALQGCP